MVRKTNSVKEILVISDIQSGSIFAPIHPESTIQNQDDKEVGMNAMQKYLWECWCQGVDLFKNPDYLVMNAEGIEGPRTETWSDNTYDQVWNAKRLLDMFEPKKTYMTRGSKYHVTLDRRALDAEEYLGDILEPTTTKVKGKRAPMELWLNVDGVIFNFAHRISGTRVPQYRSTAITREMFVTYVNQKHLWNAKVVVRSHVQYFWHIESESHHGFITPGMQVRTPYAVEYLGNGGVASLGMIRFRVVDGKFEWNGLEDKLLFDGPELKPPLVS